jgi:hypothetical protein
MDQVSEGALRLPEIQRAYVWKPAQIAGLLDSLYRRYPSGSSLLWQTTETVTEKAMATTAGDSPIFVTKPLYLLDGQQRITSLHRVFTGHEKANVVFNILTERFQIESAATKKDKRWVRAVDILSGTIDTYTLVQGLLEHVPNVPPAQLHERIERVRRIGDYSYYLEILDDLPYPEVTEVFVRVNSRGRALKETDLALATLSARWPGVVKRMDALVDECRSSRFNALDTSFAVRTLAALATETTSPGTFATTPIERLESAWGQLVRGVRHTINLLVAEVGLDNSTLLPSANALVPLAYYLGSRPEKPLSSDERNALVYWLLVAFVQARYSASAATVIAQDVGALRSPEPFKALFSNLGLLKARVEVTTSSLVGKGSTSPYFLLSYLVARRRGARDWWFGSPVALSHDDTYKVEYHHVHPRARLREVYGKAEINDLANLAFISDKANRKIAARPPATYFPELEAIDPTFLVGHLVPTSDSLRSVEAYSGFVAERRALLATAMNELLESFRPAFLDAVALTSLGDTPATLMVEAFGTSVDAGDVLLVFRAQVGEAEGAEIVRYAEVAALLADLGDGRGGEIEIAGEAIAVDADTDFLELPIGPLLVGGTLGEWRKVLGRELEDISVPDALPDVSKKPWDGPRQAFSVLDSE